VRFALSLEQTGQLGGGIRNIFENSPEDFFVVMLTDKVFFCFKLCLKELPCPFN
jgi:hypothetical protein